MYIPPDQKQVADSIFNETEQLYGRISPEKLLQLINLKETSVYQWEESSNNYGSFYFVTFHIKNKGIFQFYGMGENDRTEAFQRVFKEVECTFKNPNYDYLKASQAYRFHEHKALNKKKVISDLEYLIHQNPTEEKPQTKAGKLFADLEELLDSDGASNMLEDLGIDETIE